jgi:hypothetical protein
MGISAGVQDLHRDPATLAVHRLGDERVLLRLSLCGHLGTIREGATPFIRCDPARDDDSGAAAGALGVEGGRSKPRSASSRLRCIEPIRTRFGRVGR